MNLEDDDQICKVCGKKVFGGMEGYDGFICWDCAENESPGGIDFFNSDSDPEKK